MLLFLNTKAITLYKEKRSPLREVLHPTAKSLQENWEKATRGAL